MTHARWFLMLIAAFVLVTVLTPLALAINILRHLALGVSVNDYLYSVAIGFDQAGGSVIYGQEDYTISSYTYYLARYKNNVYAEKFMRFIDFIFGENHCEESFKKEASKRNVFKEK